MESNSLKNITSILVVATVAFLGYYLFIQKDATDLALEEGGTVASLFAQVQKYIDRNRELQRIKLDTEMLNDERFRSLVGYSAEVPEQEVGRDNPFDTARGGTN